MKINPELEKELMYAMARSRKNLVNFRKINLDTGIDECAPAPFHFDWSKRLLNGVDNEAIEGFRESAKGQYVLRAFPLYALTFPNPRYSYIVLIKNTATLAENKLIEIEDEFLNNPILSARVVSVNKRSGKVFDVDMEDDDGKIVNVRIEAYGKGASIRGLANKDRRPNIVIIDDPQDTEDARSDVTMERDWKWFVSDIYFLGQYCRTFLIGNNLGEKSIIERVFANPEELRFNTTRIPCMVEFEDRPAQSMWPAKYTIDDILQEKENFRKLGELDTWMREKMCQAVSEETRMFKKAWFKYFTPSVIPQLVGSCKAFLTIDPAFSEKDTADFRALVLNLVNDMNQWFIAEVSCGIFDMVKLIDEIFRFVTAYRLYDVHIEEGFAKILEPFIQKEMQKRNVFFNIIYLKHGGRRKAERIKMLQPRFKAGTILFPAEADWLNEMESELLAYTINGSKGLRDDVIDALAYQIQCAEPPVHGGTHNGQTLPREGDSGVSLINRPVQQVIQSPQMANLNLPREGG